jgi:hypothetical protein
VFVGERHSHPRRWIAPCTRACSSRRCRSWACCHASGEGIISLSLFVCLCLYLSICLFVCLSFCLSVCRSIFLFALRSSLPLSVALAVWPRDGQRSIIPHSYSPCAGRPFSHADVSARSSSLRCVWSGCFFFFFCALPCLHLDQTVFMRPSYVPVSLA